MPLQFFWSECKERVFQIRTEVFFNPWVAEFLPSFVLTFLIIPLWASLQDFMLEREGKD